MVAGDADQSPLSTRGPEWFTEAYHRSPGPESLLTVAGAEHGLGGVHAYGGMPMTPAENPAQVALVQQVTTAYLLSRLTGQDDAWAQSPATVPDALGRLESK